MKYKTTEKAEFVYPPAPWSHTYSYQLILLSTPNSTGQKLPLRNCLGTLPYRYRTRWDFFFDMLQLKSFGKNQVVSQLHLLAVKKGKSATWWDECGAWVYRSEEGDVLRWLALTGLWKSRWDSEAGSNSPRGILEKGLNIENHNYSNQCLGRHFIFVTLSQSYKVGAESRPSPGVGILELQTNG